MHIIRYTNKKVHVVEFIPTELKVRKTTERVKVTDLIVETDNKEHILVELNSNYDNTTKLRNLSYYTAYYSQVIERGKIYGKKLKTVLINLNKVGKEKLAKKTYLLTCNEDGIEQGLVEKSEEIAINLLKMNMSLDDIEKATGLTKKELEELKTEM